MHISNLCFWVYWFLFLACELGLCVCYNYRKLCLYISRFGFVVWIVACNIFMTMGKNLLNAVDTTLPLQYKDRPVSRLEGNILCLLWALYTYEVLACKCTTLFRRFYVGLRELPIILPNVFKTLFEILHHCGNHYEEHYIMVFEGV